MFVKGKSKKKFKNYDEIKNNNLVKKFSALNAVLFVILIAIPFIFILCLEMQRNPYSEKTPCIVSPQNDCVDTVAPTYKYNSFCDKNTFFCNFTIKRGSAYLFVALILMSIMNIIFYIITNYNRRFIDLFVLFILFSIVSFFGMIIANVRETINYTVDKPILYLYPEEDMNVKVSFENEKALLTTYPKYINEWNYLVKEDGTIIDDNGRSYYALYWDEKIKHKEKFETGFYVKSEDSLKFLEEKLFEIGLTDREANEFIMYWLPKMEENGDNLVHFELTKDREKLNKINIEPKPDSLLRISIEIKKVHKKVNIKEQKLEHFERSGFTAVEWGGSIY